MAHIIDQYDDVTGQLLSETFEGLPQLKKIASETMVVDTRRIPDHRWAVILVKEGAAQRKYPLNSPEATALSGVYFLKTAMKLPLQARRVAAKFLKSAMDEYGLTAPSVLADLAEGARHVEDNRIPFNGWESPAPAEKPRPKYAEAYALVKEGRGYFPIEDYGDMLSAVEYFRTNEREIDPLDRRQYCVKLASRIPSRESLPERMLDYASRQKDYEALSHNLMERSAYLPADHPEQTALQKVASMMKDIPGDVLVETLYQLDKRAGFDRLWDLRGGLDNPVRSVFRREKVAEKVLWDGKNDRLTDTQLKAFCRQNTAWGTLRKMLGQSGADEFKKDPITVFDSLPDDMKEMIARLASDNTIDGDQSPS